MKALVFSRKPARYAAAIVAGAIRRGRGAKYGPLEMRDIDPPELPEMDSDDWVRVRPRLAGICGSDLATLDGKASRYFEPIVSFPFVPGHEVVGELADGTRVAVIPVLHCAIRGVNPPCDMCQAGRINLCERIAYGHLEPGLQAGYCESTGGGWSTAMIAHTSQLVPVPEDFSDEAAVLIEPTACAVHAAVQAADLEIAVIGSGALGLLTIAALRGFFRPVRLIIATAKHPEQRRWAKELGADVVCEPSELNRVIRSHSNSMMLDSGQLSSGIGAVMDCVGSEESLTQALRVVAPGGTIHAVGMPGVTTLDLTSLWHREVSLRGCYAYERGDFDKAIELIRDMGLERLVSATYPLDRYADAISHAAAAGSRGAVKIAFDLRGERERNRL